MYRYYGSRYRPRGPTPTSLQILKVASDAIATLKRAGVDGCFVGGMACNLFGVLRKPNDLDILCIGSPLGQEDLKSQLVALNSRFYLWPARDPSATYKVLWYHILETDSCLKVDILLPGAMDIPNIPVSKFEFDDHHSLPCAPLSLVLLLKLQAWIHHGESPDVRYRIKQPTDAQDIRELSRVARARRLKPRTESYLPRSFVKRAESRVALLVEQYPSRRSSWVKLGFDVAEASERVVVGVQVRPSASVYARSPGIQRFGR